MGRRKPTHATRPSRPRYRLRTSTKEDAQASQRTRPLEKRKRNESPSLESLRSTPKRRRTRSGSRPRKLTERRRVKILEFMKKAHLQPVKYGVYSSEKWLDHVITYIDEKDVYRISHDDVLLWLRNNPIFKETHVNLSKSKSMTSGGGGDSSAKPGPSRKMMETMDDDDDEDDDDQPTPPVPRRMSTQKEDATATSASKKKIKEEPAPASNEAVVGSSGSNGSGSGSSGSYASSGSGSGGVPVQEFVERLNNIKIEEDEEDEVEEETAAAAAAPGEEEERSTPPVPRASTSTTTAARAQTSTRRRRCRPELRIKNYCTQLMIAVNQLVCNVNSGVQTTRFNLDILQPIAFSLNQLVNGPGRWNANRAIMN